MKGAPVIVRRPRGGPAWLLGIALGVAAFGPVGTSADSGQAAPTVSVESLLDRYSAGRHVEVLAELMSGPNVHDLRGQLEDRGESWTTARGPAAAPARRLAAASLALELSSYLLWPEDVDPLVEWGCQLVRKDASGRVADRLWFRASVAILSRTRDDGRLVTRAGPGVPRGQRILPKPRDLDHVSHARRRYPDEPRFELAEAMMAAVVADTEPPRDAPWVDDSRLDKQSFEAIRRAQARRAIEQFERLRNIPAIAHESDLRIGHLKMTLHDLSGALPHLDRASTSDDPFVAYLSLFLSGRALERLGQLAEATRLYRLALGVLPHTQSSSQALASLLLRQGQSDEAHLLAARTLGARPRTDDPWRLLGYGDLRFVPTLMYRLRGALE